MKSVGEYVYVVIFNHGPGFLRIFRNEGDAEHYASERNKYTEEQGSFWDDRVALVVKYQLQ